MACSYGSHENRASKITYDSEVDGYRREHRSQVRWLAEVSAACNAKSIEKRVES